MNEELKNALETFLTVLRNSEPIVKYLNAKEAYISDGHLIALVNQYNVQGQLLRDEGAKPERDQELIPSMPAAAMGSRPTADRTLNRPPTSSGTTNIS